MEEKLVKIKLAYCSIVFVIYYMMQNLDLHKEWKTNIFIQASFYDKKMIKVTNWIVQDRSLDTVWIPSL